MITKKNTLILLCIAILLLSFWLIYYITWSNGIQDLSQQNQQQLQQFISHLQSKLERFQAIPKLITKNSELVDALQHPENSARIDLTNYLLDDINKTIGASVTYLMDAKGLTIASSNWNSDRPFNGKNFNFRPYFKDALNGQLGRYFAIGTTSGKRGYYFSYPITHATKVIGVIAVKMNLSNIEQYWSNRATQFVVLDSQGIIFISTQKNWLYHSIKPLSKDILQTILRNKRYANHQIKPLSVHYKTTLKQNEQLITINKNEYLMQQEYMPQAQWNVMILASTNEIKTHQKTALLLLFLFYSIAILLLYLAWQRYKRRQEKNLLQKKYQQQLEHEVRVQTADLNQEIEKHKHTELMLKETQNELIQTAKLAVLGQMSASISHELNNPLAALRSYAENAQKFLELNKLQQVKDNLIRIANLTERMALISSQLKLFARKSTGTLEPIQISPVLEAAIEIIQPQIKDLNIQILLTKTKAQVHANRVQLEQVFVNILSNAIDSIKNQSDARIEITVSQTSKHTTINVSDNGTGIDDQNLDSLFEPFVTTKQSGMGLGLSISKRIIEHFNGKLSAQNKPDGGAIFTIQLLTSNQ